MMSGTEKNHVFVCLPQNTICEGRKDLCGISELSQVA